MRASSADNRRPQGSKPYHPAAVRAAREIGRLSERRLLAQPIRTLGLELAGTFVAAQVRGLYRDLEHAGLAFFRPPVYLGDEWFSPEGAPVISVPFFLAHPRLIELERKLIGAVEGGTPAWCRKLLRHEAGHCFDHAYGVSRRPEWKELFGDRRAAYDPERYEFDRTSRDYVRHLSGYYAQAHPDEDFAETFAVCVTPGASWRTKYRSWKQAFAKLQYVEALIAEHRDVKSRGDFGVRDAEASRLRSSLGRYYERRLQALRLH